MGEKVSKYLSIPLGNKVSLESINLVDFDCINPTTTNTKEEEQALTSTHI